MQLSLFISLVFSAAALWANPFEQELSQEKWARILHYKDLASFESFLSQNEKLTTYSDVCAMQLQKQALFNSCFRFGKLFYKVYKTYPKSSSKWHSACPKALPGLSLSQLQDLRPYILNRDPCFPSFKKFLDLRLYQSKDSTLNL